MSQLQYFERKLIERLLDEGENLQQISEILNRDRKTIAEEIKRNRTPIAKGAYGRKHTNCHNSWARDCSVKDICGKACTNKRAAYCWQCNKCESKCPDFTPVECMTLVSSPFCCNACPNVAICNATKYMYRASEADALAQERKSVARRGVSLSHNQLQHMSDIINAGLVKGQSFYHIAESNKDDIFCSTRYLYILKDQGYLDVKNIDMPATVGRKADLGKYKSSHKIDSACRQGRTYSDYQEYLEDNPGVLPVEMDVVEGVKDDLKCFLALTWPHLKLTVFFLLERQTARCVREVMEYLQKRLGRKYFEELFPVILTDRGSEFSDPKSIERLGTRIFYCDAGQSSQKPHVENANKQLRRIIPKGYTMQELQFQDSFTINAHINSYIKLSAAGKTPLQLLEALYPCKVIEALHLYEVAPNDIVLKPTLLEGRVRKVK